MKNEDIALKYSPQDIEDKWYEHWLDKDYFHSEPDDREPYTIVIPPPNVTGVLHMGHMLNNTIQDVLTRRARMQGKNACWVPGTDHASIATEAKVVAKLKEQGIDKKDLSRDEFLKHAWEWKDKHGGIILQQLKKLGASCDWERTKFTMDEDLYESVIDVFIDLYNKGLIYRGVRMVNWDPKALTAVSDEEVIHKEIQSKLYYLKYPVVGEKDTFVTIATTRPETILGDTAVCCHPDDERFAHLKGKSVIIPLVNREIPIIFDEYVDREFGTGCLKITPAHDINDYNIGIKHHLQSIDIFNDNGTINEKAGLYVGKDRFDVRKEIATDLEKAGHLEKIENYTNNVGFSERTDAVIEPKLSQQWFVKMQDLAKPALDVVMSDTIQFHPAKFKNTYRHWMENVKDWCISRQLWWGQRIPAFYAPNGEFVVAKTKEEALEKLRIENGELRMEDVRQDEDVLDTWFSSWLWPISLFDGIRHPGNKDISYYYPTNDLVTAPEIIFFWVARMIMAGQEYQQNIPFKNVYFTGIVRDKLGRKMSKSLGNSPDPLDLIKIYGADGVRVGMLLTSPAGNDLPFDESLCEQGRNFCNKIWNAMRLVNGWKVSEMLAQPDWARASIDWFEARMNEQIAIIEDHFEKYRLSDALMTTYKLVWDDFCSWYLEIIKPLNIIKSQEKQFSMYLGLSHGLLDSEKSIDKITYNKTIDIFGKLVQLLHPFMPFITEEIWHILGDRTEDIIISNLPKSAAFDQAIIAKFETAQQVITEVRTVRKAKNIPQKDAISLFVKKNNQQPETLFDGVVQKLCNLDKLEYISEKMEQASTFIVKSTEFFIPLGDKIDKEAEKAKLLSELKQAENLLRSTQSKLSNERFVAGAPEQVIALERKKQSDAQQKIDVITKQLEQMSS
ncbi:MAG: valine--tRNA ligase [Bacteroidales bacterium]|jgi:valyl-tRNA synthetase|nr:valine--tRNA ligase [Bacteroidales bacterium]